MGVRLALVLQRAEAGDAMDRNIAEQLVPRLQIMHISGGNNRLVHLFANLTDFAHNVTQILRTGHKTLVHQVHVHGQRLDLKHIVKLRDFHRFFSGLVQHRFKNLSPFTPGNHQQAVPVLFKLGFWNARHALVIFCM
ncbi:hypothetical protein D3C87_1749500 [compost metagenome]